jgi:hypothetical protein
LGVHVLNVKRLSFTMTASMTSAGNLPCAEAGQAQMVHNPCVNWTATEATEAASDPGRQLAAWMLGPSSCSSAARHLCCHKLSQTVLLVVRLATVAAAANHHKT